MTRFLLFRIHAPLSSWAERAGNERRATRIHPTRSGVLGLVGAALGIDREEPERLVLLHRSLWLGGCTERIGSMVSDFHTVQSPKGKKRRDQTSRSNELSFDDHDIATVLTHREYVQDGVWTLGLWLTECAKPELLSQIEEALNKPEWSLFLGRKSCPLACPLEPTCVEADSFVDALEMVEFVSSRWLSGHCGMTRDIFFDAQAPCVGVDAVSTMSRRDLVDQPVHRAFSPRLEAHARVSVSKEQIA